MAKKFGILSSVFVCMLFNSCKSVNKPLGIGDKAPQFEGVSQNGETVSLADYLGKSYVVLYFYPADNTPVCTKQACIFRDNFDDFSKLDAVIIGVSSDSIESHKNFSSKYNLPFEILSDKDGKIKTAYNVQRSMLGLLPERITYIIDKEGIIKGIYSSPFNASNHIKTALEAIKTDMKQKSQINQ